MHSIIRKYPRRRHIEGSGLQKGDHDLATEAISFCTMFKNERVAHHASA
jgi:hypothetical protein